MRNLQPTHTHTHTTYVRATNQVVLQAHLVLQHVPDGRHDLRQKDARPSTSNAVVP